MSEKAFCKVCNCVRSVKTYGRSWPEDGDMIMRATCETCGFTKCYAHIAKLVPVPKANGIATRLPNNT